MIVRFIKRQKMSCHGNKLFKIVVQIHDVLILKCLKNCDLILILQRTLEKHLHFVLKNILHIKN